MHIVYKLSLIHILNVLKGIDVSMEKGEICVLLGPSGSGKSTLLNILGGIDQADDGYIAIDGERTGNMLSLIHIYRRMDHPFLLSSLQTSEEV